MTELRLCPGRPDYVAVPYGDAAATALSNALMSNTSLQTLAVAACVPELDGLKAFRSCLQTNTSLTILEYSTTDWSDDETCEVQDAIKSELQQRKQRDHSEIKVKAAVAAKPRSV